MSSDVLLTDEHPVDPDDELLVAYLDGELTDAERDEVERRLVSDEGFRVRLQTLQTGWDWLDDLPDETPSEQLVESTIELVVADIAPKQESTTPWIQRNQRKLVIAALSVVGLLLGASGVEVSRQMQMRQELFDLAIAEDLDAYQIGDDFDFFREIDANPQWRAMLNALEVGGRTMQTPSLLKDVEVAERSRFISELPMEDRNRLEQRWTRFQRLPVATRDRIIATASSVSAQADSDRLLRTMKIYSVWRENLDDELKDALRSKDSEQRSNALAAGIEITMERLRRRSGSIISDDTADVILLRLHQLLQQRLSRSTILAADFARAKEAIGREQSEWIFMRWMVGGPSSKRGAEWIITRGMAFGSEPSGGEPPRGEPSNRPVASGRPSQAGRVPPDFRGGPSPRRDRFELNAEMEPISDSDYLQLTYLLDDEALNALEALTYSTTQFEREIEIVFALRAWTMETLDRNDPFPRAEDKSLLDRYRDQEQDERDELDLMAPDEMIRRLSPPRGFGDRSRSPRRPPR